jgi:hypothetical protein
MITLEELETPFNSMSDYRLSTSTFLLIFSRFEFALKTIGYVRLGEYSIIVTWRKFADDYIVDFDTSQNTTAKYLPLITSPPSHQTLVDDKLEWVEEPPKEPSDADLRWLLEMVYRVRNNLFHGGKWPIDGTRDTVLVKSSMWVIAKCLELNGPLKSAYFTTR